MTDTTIAPAAAPRKQRTITADVFRQFRQHRGGVIGACIFLTIILLVVFGPYVHGVDPSALNIRDKNQGISLAHPMGTDNLGRDMFAQVLAGGRTSLAVGVTAMLLSLLVGTTIGVTAGYVRRLDGWLMRLTDLFLALPLLPLLDYLRTRGVLPA